MFTAILQTIGIIVLLLLATYVAFAGLTKLFKMKGSNAAACICGVYLALLAAFIQRTIG